MEIRPSPGITPSVGIRLGSVGGKVCVTTSRSTRGMKFRPKQPVFPPLCAKVEEGKAL